MMHIRLDLKAQEVRWYINDQRIWNVGPVINVGICRLWVDLKNSEQKKIKLKDFSIKHKSKGIDKQCHKVRTLSKRRW